MPARPHAERISAVVMALAFVALCLVPHVRRWSHPSLYADDVVRIAQLQEATLGSLLFRPFNEHVAPVFEAVSWAAWRVAGRRLATAPRVFTAAAFIPFALAGAFLCRLLQRETGSVSVA